MNLFRNYRLEIEKEGKFVFYGVFSCPKKAWKKGQELYYKGIAKDFMVTASGQRIAFDSNGNVYVSKIGDDRVPVEFDSWKGDTIIILKVDENDQYPYKLGVNRAKLVIKYIKEIKKFVKDVESGKSF